MKNHDRIIDMLIVSPQLAALFMIFNIIIYRKRSVQLFKQDNAHQLMRKCHPRKAEPELCAFFHLFAEPKRTADYHGHMSAPAQGESAHFFRKLS